MAERFPSEKPVWFITGCSTGFGRELAKILLARGDRVAVTARDKAKVADLIEGHAQTALALTLDVEKQREIEAAVEATRKTFGRIDVLVNNAGYGYLAAVEEGDEADIRADVRDQRVRPRRDDRAVLPIMRAQRSGAIVNISSVGGFIGFPGSGYYAATKFAVEGLSESLSKEVAPFGIKVADRRAGSVPDRLGAAGRSRHRSSRSTPTPRPRSPAATRSRAISGIAARRSGPRGRGDHRDRRAARARR